MICYNTKASFAWRARSTAEKGHPESHPSSVTDRFGTARTQVSNAGGRAGNEQADGYGNRAVGRCGRRQHLWGNTVGRVAGMSGEGGGG